MGLGEMGLGEMGGHPSPYGDADIHGVNRKSVSISGVAHPVFIDYPCRIRSFFLGLVSGDMLRLRLDEL